MASIHLQSSGKWYISFRWAGEQFLRSSRTKSKREARLVQGLVDDTISKLRTGRLDLPDDGTEIGAFILSGGKIKAVAETITLEEAGKKYLEDAYDKGELTLKGERKHLRHFCRILNGRTKLNRIDLSALKNYARKRQAEPNRNGGTVSGATIHKEFLTYWQLWQWAFRENHVTGICPLKDPANPRKWAIRLPKQAEKEPFRTWDAIETKIRRERIAKKNRKKLWDRLYLDETQVAELLEYVGQHPKYSFMLLPFMLAARAGLRRGEIAASRTTDILLTDNIINIREGKKDKNFSTTTRHCLLSKGLRQHLEDNKLDREHLVVNRDGKHLSADSLTDQFRQTVKNSKWEVLRGWHTLRHSFASICLRKEIPIHITAKWMGHTTQEMIELYQKSYIQDEREFAKKLD